MMEAPQRRRCLLLLSFALVLGLVLWARAACHAGAVNDCKYISDTLPALPPQALCAVAVLAAALFFAGMTQHPEHRAGVALVATFLALTIVITLPVARRAHLAFAFLAFAGLLLLLTADLRRRPRARGRARAAGAALLALWLAFLLQLACFAFGWRTVGAAAQAALILGAWAYVAVLWFD